MSEKDTLGKVMLDIFSVCGLSEEAAIELMQTVSETMQVKNKELEIENESKMLAGHNKELQDGIIMIVKEYGLSSTEAYELINRLSDVGVKKDLVGTSESMDEAVKESGTCEEPKPKYKVFANMTENISGDIADVMQDVYTSGAEEKITFHDELIAQLHKRLDCKNNKDDLTLYRSIKYALEAAKEFRKGCEQLKSELRDIERYVFKFFDGSYNSVEYERQPHTSDEFDAIVKRLLELSGWADKKEFTSGEDPGDTHEPKLDQETKEKLPKGTTGDIARDTELIKSIVKKNQEKAELTPPKQTINYDALISAVAGHLDPNDWSEFNRLIKEHKELTLPMVYGDSTIGEPLNDKEFIVSLNEHRKVQLFPPVKMAVPGENELVDVDTIESETREYQRKAFDGMNITFKDVDTEKIICVSNIAATLMRCGYLSKGVKVNMAYDPQQSLEMYNIVEIVQKKNPVRELVVLVKELKKYD